MYFIAIRYLYNQKYWIIPALAIQIKDTLKNQITYLQAFLMAHMSYDYDPYYSLIYKQWIVDIFQKPESFLESLKVNHNMNNSFNYIKTQGSRDKVKNLLLGRKFEEAFNYLKNLK